MTIIDDRKARANGVEDFGGPLNECPCWRSFWRR